MAGFFSSSIIPLQNELGVFSSELLKLIGGEFGRRVARRFKDNSISGLLNICAVGEYVKQSVLDYEGYVFACKVSVVFRFFSLIEFNDFRKCVRLCQCFRK